MNVLLASVAAPPMNSPESVQTGRYIKHLIGHNITLVTTYPRGGWEPSDESLRQYLANVAQTIRVRQFPTRLTSAIDKVFPGLLFPDVNAVYHARTKRVIKAVSAKPDIVFSRSAPFSSAILGAKLSNFYKIPWLMHMSDPWANNPYHQRTQALQNRIEAVERRCVTQAALVTLTSSKAVDLYRDKYRDMAGKFRMLPNVFDDDDVGNTSISFDQKLHFVFTGRLYGSRKVHPWLDAIEKAILDHPYLERTITFSFAGFFAEENIKRIRTSPVSGVVFHGPLSAAAAAELQRAATVLVSIDAIGEQQGAYDVFFPSKLLDYFAAQRPIIAITNESSTTHDVISGTFGRCFDSGTLSQLPTYIHELARRYNDRDAKFFTVPPVIADYGAKTNAATLSRWFDELTNKR